MIKKNVIHLTRDDMNISVESNCFLEFSKLEKKFKDFKPKQNEKIFITKGINLPRIKLREYVKNENISLTTKIEKSDIIISSPESLINNYTEDQYLYFINVDDLKTIKGLFEDISFLENYPYKSVSVDWSTLQYIKNYYKGSLESNMHKVFIINNTEELENIIDKTLCYFDKLIENVQEDGVIIDYDFYKQLEGMITSTDEDNLVLAMELMANSAYNKSAAYLLILFYKYRYAFEESPKKNHVNFKGLLNYFDMIPRYIKMSFNKIIDELANKKVLTKENMDLLAENIIKPETVTTIYKNDDPGIIRPKVLVMDSPDFVKAYGDVYIINIESND